MLRLSKRQQIKFLIGGLLIAVIFAGYQIFGESFAGENGILLFKQNEDVLKIGLVTDVQAYAKKDKKIGRWKLDWKMKNALERFVQKMNKEFKPDLVIDLGDLVDGKDHRSYRSWEQANDILKNLKMPVYHILGNHETGRFLKSKWLELTGYNKTYYYKDIKKGNLEYRLIMLDSNYFPDDRDTTPENRYYPGHISKSEWQWLEKLLQESIGQKKSVLIFMHHPPLNTDSWPNWGIFPQGKELQKLFQKYNVRAVFSGHIEQMCLEKNNSTEYFVLQGMWKAKDHLKKEYRFKNAGNFYYLNIRPDDIIVKAEYRIFKKDKYKQENIDGWKNETMNDRDRYNCQDGHQLFDGNK